MEQLNFILIQRYPKLCPACRVNLTLLTFPAASRGLPYLCWTNTNCTDCVWAVGLQNLVRVKRRALSGHIHLHMLHNIPLHHSAIKSAQVQLQYCSMMQVKLFVQGHTLTVYTFNADWLKFEDWQQNIAPDVLRSGLLFYLIASLETWP